MKSSIYFGIFYFIIGLVLFLFSRIIFFEYLGIFLTGYGLRAILFQAPDYEETPKVQLIFSKRKK